MKACEDIKGTIFDIKGYAIHDGPGIRTTVFFKGCSLRCKWCHNPESLLVRPEPALRFGRCLLCEKCVEKCEQGAISKVEGSIVTDFKKCVRCGNCTYVCVVNAREIVGKEVSVSEVMEEIVKDVPFYEESGGGVTFSGGEPLVQPKFLSALLERCRAENIHTAIDTTCYADEAVVMDIAEKADMFLCDIKHMDAAKHREYTGVDNERILGNISKLVERVEVVIRIPIIGGYNDDMENLRRTAEWIAGLKKRPSVDFLPYNSAGAEKAKRLAHKMSIIKAGSPSEEKLREIADIYEKDYGLKVKIDG